MVRFITRSLLVIVLVIVIFIAGVFAGANGFFGWLTGDAPTTTTAVTLLDRIQLMAQLTTTRYSYSNILTSERELPPILQGLYGDQLVMVAVGEVNAGIDLSVLTADRIQTVDNTLVIRLPPAQLQDCFFNEQESYVISRDTGFFASPAPNLDEQARRYALAQFRDRSIEDGILADAQAQAEDSVYEMVTAVTNDQYGEVRVISDPAVTPVIPPTCQ
jgi:hypothetical protein